ncbi:MAG: Sir2 family NAD-dependent protein deacetylase [Candidatus Hodarchaeales archaeon]
MSFSSSDVKKVAEVIANSKYLVAFTGAGISTESGLPDYRGPEGVWTLRAKGLKPKSPSKPMDQIEPNPSHYSFVDLLKLDILKFIISQNVDNLHIKSGIPEELIAELHGNRTLMKCLKCDSRFSKEKIGWNIHLHGNGYRTEKEKPNQPRCLTPNCNGRIISSIVNFNDPMPEKEMRIAEEHSRACDAILCVGSTLSVFPAANYPVIAKNNGAILIIINMGETYQDQIASIRIEAKSGEILPLIVDDVKKILA